MELELWGESWFWIKPALPGLRAASGAEFTTEYLGISVSGIVVMVWDKCFMFGLNWAVLNLQLAKGSFRWRVQRR